MLGPSVAPEASRCQGTARSPTAPTSVLDLVGGDEHDATHAYAASKGGISALSQAIAAYYAPRRIRANISAPGLMRTRMSLRAQVDPAILADLPRLQPLAGNFGASNDIAEAARYLASDAERPWRPPVSRFPAPTTQSSRWLVVPSKTWTRAGSIWR